MSKELDLVDHYDQMNKVVERMLKGQKSGVIAKALGLKLVEVNSYIEEWQSVAKNSKHIQERAGEALTATDQHYDMIVSELWDSVELSGQDGDIRTKNGALKMIADIERQRIEMLQKSGLLDNQQLAEQVLEAERKQNVLVKILRELASKYPEAAAYVREELSKVTGQVEGTVITIESE